MPKKLKNSVHDVDGAGPGIVDKHFWDYKRIHDLADAIARRVRVSDVDEYVGVWTLELSELVDKYMPDGDSDEETFE